MGHFPAARKPPGRLLPQKIIAAAGAVLPAAVAPAPQKKQGAVIAEGIGPLLRTDPHAVHPGGIFQGDDIGAFLVHPGEVHTGEVDKGIMTGKDDLLRLYPSPGRDNLRFFHALDRGVLVNGQRLGNGPEKLQRVELGLVFKTNRPGGGKGQLGLLHESGRQAQSGGSLRFLPELGCVAAVDAGVPLLQVAVDILGSNDAPVLLQGGGVGLGVLSGFLLAQGADQLFVEQAVLAGELGGGVPGLAAGDSLRFQDNDAAARLLQGGGNQNASHAGTDDGNVRFHVAGQSFPLPEPAGL